MQPQNLQTADNIFNGSERIIDAYPLMAVNRPDVYLRAVLIQLKILAVHTLRWAWLCLYSIVVYDQVKRVLLSKYTKTGCAEIVSTPAYFFIFLVNLKREKFW